MKLQPLQLCRLCGSFRSRWRLIALTAALPVLLLLPLPGALRTAAVSLWGLTGSLLLMYRFLVNGSKLPVCLRSPVPEDGLCETVLVDAALLGQGTQVRAVAQPVDIAPEMSLRLGSGTLLLGAAMVHHAASLPLAEQSALQRAVHRINLVPQRLTQHQPVLARTEEGGVITVIVRDGANTRRYLMGSAEVIVPLCPRIWETEARPMTDHDLLRVLDTARFIAQGCRSVYAYATALEDEEPVYLGAAGVGTEVDLKALQDLTELRRSGLTLMLHAGDDPNVDLPALRSLAGIPEHHARPDVYLTCGAKAHPTALAIHRDPGDSLLAPVLALQESYRSVESMLRAFALMAMLALLPGLAGHWAMALAVCLLMVAGAALLSPESARPLPGRLTLTLFGLLTILAWAFLSALDALAAGCCLLTLTALLGSLARYCGLTGRRALKAQSRTAGIFGAVCTVIFVAAALLLGGTHHPAGLVFSLLMGCGCALLLLRGK